MQGNKGESTELGRSKLAVYRLLKFRPRTEFELRSKLKEKEFSSLIIDQTLIYFKNIDLVNDEKFAKGWLQSRLKKPFGLNRIKRELKAKGIDNILIQSVCADRPDQDEEVNAIEELATRRLRQYRHLPPLKARQRLTAYLIRRGFRPSAVYKSLTKLFKKNER